MWYHSALYGPVPTATMLVLIALASGCASTQYQQHYLAAADIEDEDPTLSYYRVTSKAKVNNKEMEFLAGFYDANAVRQLYGQVGPAPGGNTHSVRGTSGPTAISYDPETGTWQPFNEQVYTIIYSADASAIAKQIKHFATSETVGKQLGSLMASAVVGDELVEAEDREAEISAAKTRLGANVQKQAETIVANTTPEAKAAILAAMRELALELTRINGGATVAVPNDLSALASYIKAQKALYEQNL